MNFISSVVNSLYKNISVVVTILIINFFPAGLKAQSGQFQLPSGLSLSNQLEYSYDIEREIEILENWLNLDYRHAVFSAGIRLDVFQPNDPDPSISRGKERYADIAFKYINAGFGDIETGAEITVGNFYELFGRGLVVKSYEDRNIRIDNNLLGVSLKGRYAGFIIKAFSGSAENSQAERKDILHAVDLEYEGIGNLNPGITFALNQSEVESIANTRMAAFRIQPSIWNFDLYTEYGVKMNKDIRNNIFGGEEDFAGEAFYGSLNFYFDSFSIVGEYKYYDNFTFSSQDGTVIYNTPPAVRKEYAYTLLNRHPSPLNQNNEQGFQLEGFYSLSPETDFLTAYSQTRTLPSASYYQRTTGINQPVQTQLKEVYIQANHHWSDFIYTVAALGYNEELDSDTKSITPIIENRFYFDDINTIKVVLEHQQVTDRRTNEQYYDDLISVEYLKSPDFSVSLVTDLQTREPQPGRIVRQLWAFVQFGYKISSHSDLSLLIGSRQAGNICIGGVCRYEPEFRGVEFKMLTRL